MRNRFLPIATSRRDRDHLMPSVLRAEIVTGGGAHAAMRDGLYHRDRTSVNTDAARHPPTGRTA